MVKPGQNCKKCTFLHNSKTITQEGNIETRKTTFILLFENSQISYWCDPFWSVKYLTFGRKLLIRTTHHAFLESRHPEVTKHPYYVLSPEYSQEKLMDYVWRFKNLILKFSGRLLLSRHHLLEMPWVTKEIFPPYMHLI